VDAPCIEHAARLTGVELRQKRLEDEQVTTVCVLRKIQASSRATLIAAIATPLGAVLVALIAGWFALAQTREQARLQAAATARQVSEDADAGARLAERERAVEAALERQRSEFQRWAASRQVEAARAAEHRVAAEKRTR
jgi:uncharacterized membrane protein YcjF (UPF0283 family)